MSHILEKTAARLTNDFTNHEKQADDRDHIQPPLGDLLLPLTILLCAAVVMAMLDATSAVYLQRHLVGHTGCTFKKN